MVIWPAAGPFCLVIPLQMKLDEADPEPRELPLPPWIRMWIRYGERMTLEEYTDAVAYHVLKTMDEEEKA